MDRMLYIAMAGARQIEMAQAVNAHNLANASTTGFREDLAALRSQPVFGAGYQSRVYAMAERPGVNLSPGTVVGTGRDLDVSIDGEGYIALQGRDGNEAYSRAGDLRVSANGMLETMSGFAVLGNDGPIAIPPAEKITIGADGTVSIRPVGQDATTTAVINRIKLVNPGRETLTKSADGLLRLTDGPGAEAPADASVRISSGSLEGSNVNAIDALVDMISLARQFELQIKAMKTIEQVDESSAQLMRIS
jgi:flagellar basal-body rod protein FlgF